MAPDDKPNGSVEPTTTEPVVDDPTASEDEPEAETETEEIAEPTQRATHPVYDFGSSVAKVPEVSWGEKQRRRGENKQVRKNGNK